jgi:DNA-binding transcriptional MerR regulator
VNIVKKIMPILTIPMVMIMLACLIIPAYAMPGKDSGIPGGKMGGGTMTAQLDHLEEQGYEVSEIRAAIENGDNATARSLMQQFMEEHKDELPSPGHHVDRMTAQLDHLEEQGYDISAIRAAIEHGDNATARSLMQQFMEEHKDELPSPGHHVDRMTAQLDHLEEQGYDISAIRAAIESGDNATARSLMQQFMEEHKDELPSPPDRERPTQGIP